MWVVNNVPLGVKQMHRVCFRDSSLTDNVKHSLRGYIMEGGDSIAHSITLLITTHLNCLSEFQL